jgi:hypothetical protein
LFELATNVGIKKKVLPPKQATACKQKITHMMKGVE